MSDVGTVVELERRKSGAGGDGPCAGERDVNGKEEGRNDGEGDRACDERPDECH